VPVGTYRLVAHRKGWELETGVLVSRGNVTVSKVEFPYGSIEVSGDPAGLAMALNGVAVGNTPITLRELKPGPYTLTATDGENELNADIPVGLREQARHSFAFRYGAVRLTSTPTGATVIRKGKEIGTTPLTLAHLAVDASGGVELRLTGYAPAVDFALKVVEGVTTNLNAKLFSERYLQAMKQAREAFDAGQFAEAQKSITMAEELEPDDNHVKALRSEISFMIHYQKAELLLSSNNQFSEALAELEEAGKFHPASEDVLKLRQKIEKQRLERFNGLVQHSEISLSRRLIEEANHDLDEADKLIANDSKVAKLRARIAPALRNIFWKEVAGKIADSPLTQSHVWTFKTDWAGTRRRTDEILNGFLGAWKVQSESRPNNQTITLILEPRGIYRTSSFSCALMLSEVQSGVIEIRSKMCVDNTRGWEGQQLLSLDKTLFSDLQQQFGQPLNR
jgi:tetratricopeptide (TPR) repeat protein